MIPDVNKIEFDVDGYLDADDLNKLSDSTKELSSVVDAQSAREKNLESKIKSIKKDIDSEIGKEFGALTADLKDMTTVRFRIDTYLNILKDFVESTDKALKKK